MKLFKIDEAFEQFEKKAAEYKEKLGITDDQASAIYAVAKGSLPYTLEALKKYEIVTTMLKQSIFRNILGNDIDMQDLEDFLRFSLSAEKIEKAKKNYGKYVFQAHFYEDADAICDVHDTYIVCDYTDEMKAGDDEDEALEVYLIESELWCFDLIKIGVENWKRDFPDLVETVEALRK